MASSSPLSEPPSSPPRAPERSRSRKRGSFDPSTPRTARRLRSISREDTPRTTSSPGRETSKKKGEEVAPPLTLKEATRLATHFARVRGLHDDNDDDDNDDDDDDDDNIGDLYEDCSESEPVSPTAGEKYAGPPTRGGEKTLRSVDRQWSALESEDAHRALLARMKKLKSVIRTRATHDNLEAHRCVMDNQTTTLRRNSRKTKRLSPASPKQRPPSWPPSHPR